MECRENLHKLVRRALKNGDIPPGIIDAIDAAYVAGMDDRGKCSRCEQPFEGHHHRHIVKTGIYHTRCYNRVIQAKGR